MRLSQLYKSIIMMSKKYKTFYEYIGSKVYCSILVLDGDLPDKSFFESKLPIIAADGAMNSLYALGITPRIVIGDLDSVNPKILGDVEVLCRPDQNRFDFQKALDYLDTTHLLPAIIVGVNGGYIDHILNNINIFLNQNCIFYAPPIVGQVVRAGETHFFSLPLNTKISLIAFPKAQLSTQGLEWELQEDELCFPGKNSVSNRIRSESISIKVHTGLILILVYL